MQYTCANDKQIGARQMNVNFSFPVPIASKCQTQNARSKRGTRPCTSAGLQEGSRESLYKTACCARGCGLSDACVWLLSPRAGYRVA